MPVELSERSAHLSVPAIFFAPGLNPRENIISRVNSATKSIHGSAYNFSSAEITAALIDAKKRGAKEEWIIDHKALAETSCTAAELVKAGIPVYDDAKERIHHSKYMVLDGKTVITGSYNFSSNAEHNAENLLIIDDPAIAALYEADWQKHLQHAVKWDGKKPRAETTPEEE